MIDSPSLLFFSALRVTECTVSRKRLAAIPSPFVLPVLHSTRVDVNLKWVVYAALPTGHTCVMLLKM